MSHPAEVSPVTSEANASVPAGDAAVSERGPAHRARGPLRPLRAVASMSLAQRFLVANLGILLVAGLVVGIWMGNQLERSIVERTASVTALYVESIIEPSVASMADGGELTALEIATLDRHLASSALSERVRSMRIWSADGQVVYSPNAALIGQQFPVEGHLAEAWAGDVAIEMDDLSGAENAWERARWNRLLEMYVPVRERGTENIIAVAEFYLPPKDIDEQVAQARLTAWSLVTLAIVLAGLLLWRVVKRGSDTIQRQEVALSRQVDELTDLLEQNAELSERVHQAAERTTTLNERSMRRVSSDLHDGPGQMLSLAMLRLDGLQKRAERGDPPSAAEIAEVEAVLDEAMADMRGVAAGLRLPELAPMDVESVASRAVQDHQRRSGTPVELHADHIPDQVPLPVKIALFRALQESLSNATRHGRSEHVEVRLRGAPDRLLGPGLSLTVRDDGVGFDSAVLSRTDGLGLAGIREQAEVLGGSFEVNSVPGDGTELQVWWPIELGTADRD
ncbi:MAG: sensor histidine kinase [Chloroflexota bacterium]